MPQNNLAGYFTDSDKINETSGDGDIGGRTFFDVIAECKDFSNLINKFKKSLSKINFNLQD